MPVLLFPRDAASGVLRYWSSWLPPVLFRRLSVRRCPRLLQCFAYVAACVGSRTVGDNGGGGTGCAAAVFVVVSRGAVFVYV